MSQSASPLDCLIKGVRKAPLCRRVLDGVDGGD